MFLTYVKACLTAAYETQIFYFLFNFSLFVGSKLNCTTKSTFIIEKLKGRKEGFIEISKNLPRCSSTIFWCVFISTTTIHKDILNETVDYTCF